MAIASTLTDLVFGLTRQAGLRRLAESTQLVRIASRIVPVSMRLDPSKWGRLDPVDSFEQQFAPHGIDMECGIIADREQGELKELAWYVIRNMEVQADDRKVDLERYGEIIIGGQVWGHVRAKSLLKGTPVKTEEYFVMLPGFGSIQVIFTAREDVFDAAAPLRDAASATLQIHPSIIANSAELNDWIPD
jgi:hypothetical protein